MKTVYLFFANGFEEIEALATVDILRRAGLNVKTVSVTSELLVTGANGVPVQCDMDFDQGSFEDLDALVLPGGMPGASSLKAHAGLRELILATAAQNKLIAAICAAPMVLGSLGLLKGKKATCYPGFERYLEGADITGEESVIDGLIITGKGPGTTFDFAFDLVRTLVNEEKVSEVKAAMMYVGAR